MATVLQVVEVETLRQYMEAIEDLMAPDVPLWYRGAGRASHRLVPSLFRHPIITTAADLLKLERRMIQRFAERSVPYQTVPIHGDWEPLFLMQHFGVPTRLLDWTENPYIGLYFALTSATVDEASGAADEPAAVWVLKPEEWNRQALGDVSYDGGVLSIGNALLNSYAPSADAGAMRVTPVAMYGIHNSQRIVAQKGVFTIFGKETQPVEELFAANEYPDGVLVKIDVPASVVGPLRDSLFAIGITDSMVYPDLSGLASELKRFFGYYV